jgi:sensor c-di-GMP phosphodiesterase-like protein
MNIRRILRFQFVNSAVIAAFVLVPLLAGIALSVHQTQTMQRREAETAAALLKSQVSNMLALARKAASDMQSAATGSCAELMPALIREAAIVPYLRSVNVLEKDVVICSSASGVISEPLSSFLGAPNPTPMTVPWGAVVTGTSLVQASPALLLGYPVAQGRTVMVVIDGRYFLDILHSILPLDIIQQADLAFADSQPLYAVPQGASAPEESSLGKVLFETEIDRDLPVRARFYERREGFYDILLDNLLGVMPVAISASFLVAWLMRVLMLRMLSDRERLLHAIRKKEFHVVYQPQVNLVTRRCEGVEALLRWERRRGELMPPDRFISLAEAEGVIVPLTLHLMELVAQEAKGWNVRPGFHLGMNFSAEHISTPGVVIDIQRFRQALDNPAISVGLEVTERDLVSDIDAASKHLEELRTAGVRVAIDDFGVGYCSLSYLEALPLDILKIDKGFVQSVDREKNRAVVLDAIIGLGKELGASLIAEGVESTEQMDYLRRHGVSIIQGYLFAKPMRAASFLEWYSRSEQEISSILSRD